ncbi:hypothetical protein RRG08_016484 [Elysia crispata]|uniref:Uncharacterized protein n=1 Tax=Elysia crispata TaxID=231223 RepID=A0AAE1CUR1_9GAST|nr:hypothetical protein RRG08_016484 [Elysia crispata]
MTVRRTTTSGLLNHRPYVGLVQQPQRRRRRLTWARQDLPTSQIHRQAAQDLPTSQIHRQTAQDLPTSQIHRQAAQDLPTSKQDLSQMKAD